MAFDRLMSYTMDIGQKNGASGSALAILHHDHFTSYYSGHHTHDAGAPPIRENSQFHIASARKSYIGFAAALAVYEHKIQSIDDPVSRYLPDWDKDILSHTTIRHLLTHTHGLSEHPDGHVYRKFSPGTHWSYENINVVMIAEIVRRTIGQSVGELLRERVFKQLHFKETHWLTEPNESMVSVITENGSDLPLGLGDNGDEKNLYVSARELTYWGYLHLRRGNIGGNQIIPEAVFDLATSLQSPNLSNTALPENGFFWYVKTRDTALSEIGALVPRGSYQILGVTGPLLLVIPEHDLVIARMYNKRYNYGGNHYLHYLREFGDEVMRCLQA
ncbi:serine hydrolase [Ectobacillus antri]|uniref:Serine hydrolase n=1 Tax=Ectobacillus antri TaxID=2486280 RepID=A0ABT6H969_9BACI|nr:serine hydrolase domain-containing protein [Ectobacillus antri]MDG4658306.1 serine hydrolase [Ectobacillus antri]MDG5755527.1 serine hydrolase [Ectobacillus antri]